MEVLEGIIGATKKLSHHQGVANENDAGAPGGPEPIGYTALLARYSIEVARPRCQSYIGTQRATRETEVGRVETWTKQALLDESDVGHLLFVVKREDIDLLVLTKVFEHVDPAELCAAIGAKPTSMYLRRLWFFWEFLTGRALALPDSTSTTGYTDVLPTAEYYTRPAPLKLARYRVNNNLLGNSGWCPIVRKTKKLEDFETKRLNDRASSAVQQMNPADLARAIGYLHTKETHASFELEEESPSDRANRFAKALFDKSTQGRGTPWWNEARYAELYNELASPKFSTGGYRNEEVWIGQQPRLDRPAKIDWVGANWEDVRDLMDSHASAWQRHQLKELKQAVDGATIVDGKPYEFQASCGDPFVDFLFAGCLSFGFVYIHPLLDCNGRIHRLMLQHILGSMRFTPAGVPIPISAAILNDRFGYVAALEAHSKRVLRFVNYETFSDDEGTKVKVPREATPYYRYIDMTSQLEALCGWFETGITKELVDELRIIRFFDRAKDAMREVVAMPDKLERQFLSLAFHNFERGNGFIVGASKRKKLFGALDAEDFRGLQQALRDSWDETGSDDGGGLRWKAEDLTEEQTLWFAYRHGVTIEVDEVGPGQFKAKVIRRLDGFPVLTIEMSALHVEAEWRTALESAWALANEAALTQVRELRVQLGDWNAVARSLAPRGSQLEDLATRAERQLALEGKFHRRLLGPNEQ